MLMVKYSISWSLDGDIISITFHLPEMSLYIRASDVSLILEESGDLSAGSKAALLAHLRLAYAKKREHLLKIEEQMAARALSETARQCPPNRFVNLDFSVEDITGE